MLVDFYTKVLTSMGLVVTSDGFIKIPDGAVSYPLTIDGKSLVLPTKEHIGSVMGTDEDGELAVIKIPYNPLNENVLKGDSVSLTKTKNMIEKYLGHGIAAVGELMLRLAREKEFQKKTNIEMNEFLAKINTARAAGQKEVVDDKSLSLWANIYKKTYTEEFGFVSIYLKKSVKHDGVKYNRLATISSPVYDELIKAEKDTPVFGQTLRRKELIIFRIILETILEGIDVDPNTITYGSNDDESPGFISLFMLYKKIGDRIVKLLSYLKDIDQSVADSVTINTSIFTEEEILSASTLYKSELLIIPNEHDLAREKHISGLRDTHVGMAIANDNKLKLPIAAVQPTQQQYSQPMQQPAPQMQQQNTYQQPVQQPAPYQSPVDTMYADDPIKKILYGNNIPVQRSYSKEEIAAMQYQQQMQQQGMYPQGMMQQQPVPMGMNMVQQPMMPQYPQQGMYPQGMMQQQPVPMGMNMVQQPMMPQFPQQNMFQQQAAPMGINYGQRF